MAKKKGGKKKSKTSAKKKKGKPTKPKTQPKPKKEVAVVEQPEEEVIEQEPVIEPEEIIEPEPVEDEAQEEIIEDSDAEGSDSQLSDAVSAVISGKAEDEEKETPKKKKSPTYKKREKLLLQWAAEGYDVENMEKWLEEGKRGLKGLFDQFEANITRIEEIKKELEGSDLEGLDALIEEFNKLLSNPNDLENIEYEFTKLQSAKRVEEIKKELDGMVLDSLKERVEETRALLDDPDNLEEVEDRLVDLKKDYKEAYFEDGVESMVVTTDAKPKAKAKKPAGNGKRPMEVKDIFLLYKDGKFISHHTARVVPKEEQEQLFADLKTGRNYLKSPNYKPQKLNVISINGRKILVQGGKYTVIIMVVAGDVNPWTEKIIAKVQGLLEKEDGPALTKWNGDVASLKSAGKYMTALLYACMKLSKKK